MASEMFCTEHPSCIHRTFASRRISRFAIAQTKTRPENEDMDDTHTEET